MTKINLTRPEILFPCFAQLINLPGIGPQTANIMSKRIGNFTIDLAFYLPISLINRTASPDINKTIDGQIVTLIVTILSMDIPGAKQARPARIIEDLT